VGARLRYELWRHSNTASMLAGIRNHRNLVCVKIYDGICPERSRSYTCHHCSAFRTWGLPNKRVYPTIRPVAPAAGWVSGSYPHHLKELMDKKIIAHLYGTHLKRLSCWVSGSYPHHLKELMDKKIIAHLYGTHLKRLSCFRSLNKHKIV
jgi:hypothetical protein